MNAVKKTHYAWVVAGVTFVVILFASSVQGVFSLLIQPLMTEFGWSRSVATLPASVNILVYGVTGPFAAALTIRFGLRGVVTDGQHVAGRYRRLRPHRVVGIGLAL